MKRKWMALLLMAVLLLSLAACGDDENADAEAAEDPEAAADAAPEPLTYDLEGIQVEALPASDTVPAPRQLSVYTYENLPQTGAELVAGYAETLTDSGFSFIDDGLVRAETPALDTETGMVRLGKKAVFPEPEPVEGEEEKAEGEEAGGEETETEPPRPDQVVVLQLDWTAETCTVTTELVEGRLTDPPDPAEEAAAVAAEAMTNQELEDYVRTLSPSVFGLEGASMEEYRVYINTGMVTVDEIPCQRLEIFHIDEESGTNEVAGSYFMSSNGEYLYHYDLLDGTITELEVPPREEPEAGEG